VINFHELAKALGKDLNFDNGTPLAGACNSNKHIQGAMILNCDLFLGKPLSSLVGFKLSEAISRVNKSQNILESLYHKVEFPDIRALVNNGTLKLDDVLSIRKKAKRFREWLQTEKARDRDAIIAYHNEVSNSLGLSKLGNKSLNFFGVIGGSIAGSIIGQESGALIGATSGAGLQYLINLGLKYGTEWKPVIFGNWLSDYAQKKK
jgi:hypothetical protein